MAQPRGQRLLVVEAQPLLAPAGDQVQAPTQARERASLAVERGEFVLAELAHGHQRFQVARAGHAPRHPAQRLQVAQAAGAVLEVGLEVVRGVAEARVAVAQLLALGVEERARRPAALRRDGVGQRAHRILGAVQQARVELRGEHGDVGDRRIVLRQRAHRMAQRQAAVPEQREEPRQRLAVPRLRGFVGQHQQVDVRLRKQLAMPIAAHREQRQAGVVAQAAHPGISQQRIHRGAARAGQAVDVLASVEAR